MTPLQKWQLYAAHGYILTVREHWLPTTLQQQQQETALKKRWGLTESGKRLKQKTVYTIKKVSPFFTLIEMVTFGKILVLQLTGLPAANIKKESLFGDTLARFWDYHCHRAI